jgi:phage shock protein PspC (stress-responsive transcriptional regulator)
MDAARKCPYCAEEIAVEALRCPHCRSHLASVDAAPWHRDHPERRVAGVAAALSRGLGLPIVPVRIAFVVLTFFHLAGPLLYGTLWLLLPFRADEESLLERALGRAKEAVRQLRSGPRGGSWGTMP